MLLLLRQELYKRKVLRGGVITYPTIMQLTVLHTLLLSRNALYMSIGELCASELYRHNQRTGKQLADAFDHLVRQGVMVRSYRDAKNGNGKVLIWGLTGKGKEYLRLFYAYIAGEHDAELGLDVGTLLDKARR